MIAPGSWIWFARHETRLAWRDALAMLQGGRQRHRGWAVAAVAIGSLVMHLVAYGVLRSAAMDIAHPNKEALVVVSGSAFLAWTLLLSQAMETVTRGFYARADLDLILSSPAPAERIFAIRIGAIAVSTTAMAALVLGPFINVMAMLAGPRFLFAYGVLAAMGCSAAALSVCATLLLFRLFGPRRTRLLAQITAAVIGAGFVIGVQAVAIVSYGSMSRTLMFRSPEWIAAAPDVASPFWWPARAGMGDGRALAFVLAGAAGFLALTVAWAAGTFARNISSVEGHARSRSAAPTGIVAFGRQSPAQVLRQKEWTLLKRDPWLASQSLMQILYLVPPALLLWRDLGTDIGGLVVLVPILVMAAGQLGGGLAWLALSGEDAPDLVATAPVPASSILRAKVEAVMMVVALPIVPFAIAMAWASPFVAATMVIGAGLAAAGASAVQWFFKSQAKRSNSRRRQASSRIATFAEAFLSISVAAAAGLAAAGLWFAVVPMGVALAVLLTSRAVTTSTAS